MADAHWGRYKTICIFCALYIVGLGLATVGAWPDLDQKWALLFSLTGLFVGVTVGAGGIKSNVVVLGADQFELPAQAEQQASFFNFFYWSINIGATASYLFLANVALHGLGSLIPVRSCDTALNTSSLTYHHQTPDNEPIRALIQERVGFFALFTLQL